MVSLTDHEPTAGQVCAGEEVRILVKWLEILKDARAVGVELQDLKDALKGMGRVREVLKKTAEWATICEEFEQFVAALRALADDV